MTLLFPNPQPPIPALYLHVQHCLCPPPLHSLNLHPKILSRLVDVEPFQAVQVYNSTKLEHHGMICRRLQLLHLEKGEGEGKGGGIGYLVPISIPTSILKVHTSSLHQHSYQHSRVHNMQQTLGARKRASLTLPTIIFLSRASLTCFCFSSLQ